MSLQKTAYENGFTLLTYPVKQDDVNIDLLIPSGHADMVPEAHFIEHMAFQSNTHKTAQEIIDELEGKAINYDAWTFNDRTHFHMTSPPQHVTPAIQSLYECVTNTTFQPDEVEREKEILKGELSTIRSNPFQSIEQKMKACVYQNHPLNIKQETYDNIKEMTPQRLAFAKQHLFFTHDFVLGISGNIKTIQISRLIKTTFGTIQKKKNNKQPYPAQQPSFHDITEERTDITTSCVLIAFPVVGIDHPDSTSIKFITYLLGGSRGGYMFSNRLFQEIRAKQGLAYETHTLYESYPGTGLLVLSASGMKKQNAQKVKSLILEQLDRLTREEIKPDEFERVRTNILTSEYRYKYTRIDSMNASRTLSELYHTPWGYDVFKQDIMALTPKKIRAVADTYFQGKYFIGIIMPK